MAPKVRMPIGWGEDNSTSFFEACTENTYTAFEIQKAWYKRLSDIRADRDP